MLGDLLFPRAAVPALVGWVGWRRLIGFFQCPCLGQDHMAGDTRCLFPRFLTGGSSWMPAQLAAFIDSFCFNKADGAELKTNITQTNLKPWGG